MNLTPTVERFHPGRVALVALLLLLATACAAFAVEPIGQALRAVETRAFGRGKLQSGDAVFLGDEFAVGRYGTLNIQFDDESSLTLAPGSLARISPGLDKTSTRYGTTTFIIQVNGSYRWIPGHDISLGSLQVIDNRELFTPEESEGWTVPLPQQVAPAAKPSPPAQVVEDTLPIEPPHKVESAPVAPSRAAAATPKKQEPNPPHTAKSPVPAPKEKIPTATASQEKPSPSAREQVRPAADTGTIPKAAAPPKTVERTPRPTAPPTEPATPAPTPPPAAPPVSHRADETVVRDEKPTATPGGTASNIESPEATTKGEPKPEGNPATPPPVTPTETLTHDDVVSAPPQDPSAIAPLAAPPTSETAESATRGTDAKPASSAEEPVQPVPAPTAPPPAGT